MALLVFRREKHVRGERAEGCRAAGERRRPRNDGRESVLEDGEVQALDFEREEPKAIEETVGKVATAISESLSLARCLPLSQPITLDFTHNTGDEARRAFSSTRGIGSMESKDRPHHVSSSRSLAGSCSLAFAVSVSLSTRKLTFVCFLNC